MFRVADAFRGRALLCAARGRAAEDYPKLSSSGRARAWVLIMIQIRPDVREGTPRVGKVIARLGIANGN